MLLVLRHRYFPTSYERRLENAMGLHRTVSTRRRVDSVCVRQSDCSNVRQSCRAEDSQDKTPNFLLEYPRCFVLIRQSGCDGSRPSQSQISHPARKDPGSKPFDLSRLLSSARLNSRRTIRTCLSTPLQVLRTRTQTRDQVL